MVAAAVDETHEAAHGRYSGAEDPACIGLIMLWTWAEDF